MLLSLLVIMAKTRDLQVSWSSICQQRKAKAPWQTSNYQSRRTISSSSHPDHRLTVQLDSGKTQRLRMSGQEATLLEIRNTQSSPQLLQAHRKPMLLQFKSSHVSPRNTHDRATVIWWTTSSHLKRRWSSCPSLLQRTLTWKVKRIKAWLNRTRET